jgi:hypothetical protein
LALIACAVYDTEENQRTTLTRRTLASLFQTVDFSQHRLVISDNGSCQATQELYETLPWRHNGHLTILKNGANIGTARAINRGWQLREPGEFCVKMDNDVEFGQAGWVDEMERAVARQPRIGIVGLKRKDLEERPDHDNPWYRSRLLMLPHRAGEPWVVCEDVQHVMGTCQLYAAALLDKMGYLYQMQDMGNLYGLDDSLASARAHLLKFWTVFLPHIPIDHIDKGGDAFTEWKQANAKIWLPRYEQVLREYASGVRSPYWEDAE